MCIVRGGGGFHAPSMRLYQPYIHKRRIGLTEVTTTIFHDVAPEHHVGLHSLEYKTGGHAGLRILQFFLMAAPFFALGMYVSDKLGYTLRPASVNCPDQKDMLPAFINFLRKQDVTNAQDFIGRNNETFYRLSNPEDFTADTKFIRKLRANGFNI